MSSLVIKYDGEAVFEGTIKDDNVELDFKSGFDALVREVDSIGEDLVFKVIRRFVKGHGVDVDKCIETKYHLLGATSAYTAHMLMSMFNDREKAIKAARDFADKSGHRGKFPASFLENIRYDKDKMVWLVTLRKAFSTNRLLVTVNNNMEVVEFEMVEGPEGKTNKKESRNER